MFESLKRDIMTEGSVAEDEGRLDTALDKKIRWTEESKSNLKLRDEAEGGFVRKPLGV